MSTRRLILYDDATARRWHPLTLTRPAGELRFGDATLRERAERVLGVPCTGHVADPALASYDEPWAGEVVAADSLPTGPLILLSSRAVLEVGATLPAGEGLLAVGDTVCGWTGPGETAPIHALLDGRSAPDLGVHRLEGRLLDHVWELMSRNADRLDRDLRARLGQRSRPALPDGVHLIGDAPVAFGHEVEIEPGAVFDARSGPIWIEDGTTVRSHSRIEGPFHAGPGCTLFGGSYSASSIGPVSKVRGELEASVILGYSNKAHDGFLGHAYVGCWVNLGALTTNSDLKNNYGTVRIWTPDGETDTGESKIGCLLGDHVKTAIGTLLNTGTVVGPASNIFGTGMPPKYVPPFSWGGAGGASYDIDRFLETAEVVMKRRDVVLSEGQRRVLRAVFERAEAEAG